MSDILDSVVDSVLVPRSDAHAPPGAAFAIMEGGELHVTARGAADLDGGATLTLGHSHDLASVSKTLTVLTLRRLFADGSLQEADTLGRLLGSRAGQHSEVTLDELLRHRGGLAEWWPLYLMPDATDDPVAAALSLSPRYPRGQGRHYSDLGMQALGGVITSAVGLPFSEAVRALLLEPLQATTVTPGQPLPGTPAVSGPGGDAIEREMVRSGIPYPVHADADAFPWRTGTIRGEAADGNAFHAFGGAAGHAGWFSDVDGLLRVAGAIADPDRYGLGAETARALATTLDPGQGQGLRIYRAHWRGEPRVFLGHGGFTGTFVAASPATGTAPEVLTVFLTNRLHGHPAPERDRLVPVEPLWIETMGRADTALHPTTTGERL